MIAPRPTGPAPTTATVSPGLVLPFRIPISKPVGSASVRKRRPHRSDPPEPGGPRSLRREHARTLPGCRQSCNRNPADTTNGLAVRRLVRLTVGALTAAGHGGNDDAVADLQVSHRGANLGNGTDSLVAQDASVVHLGAVALQDVQVSTANGGWCRRGR